MTIIKKSFHFARILPLFLFVLVEELFLAPPLLDFFHHAEVGAENFQKKVKVLSFLLGPLSTLHYAYFPGEEKVPRTLLSALFAYLIDHIADRITLMIVVFIMGATCVLHYDACCCVLFLWGRHQQFNKIIS